MSLLQWEDLIPEAQIYMLKKQYATHHKYSIEPYLKSIVASKPVGGFDWDADESKVMLDIIMGKYRKVIRCSMHLFLYKYIK